MEDRDQIICRCEEITLGEVLDAIKRGASDVDAVKRMTRAGMGLCQGRTCGRIISGIIAGELRKTPADIVQVTQRIPVRPVAASVLAACPDID